MFITLKSQKPDPHKRKESHIEGIKELQKYLGVQINITNTSRIGRMGKDVKPHLLKVTVNSSHERAQVLKNCTKVCKKDYPKVVQSIYVAPYLTTKKQKENKELCNQLTELNKSE